MDRAQFFRSDRSWRISFCEFHWYQFVTISNEPPWKYDQDSVSIFLFEEILRKIFRFEICENVRTARSNFEKITFFQFSRKRTTLHQRAIQNLDRIFKAVLMHYPVTGISRDQHELFLESSYEKLYTIQYVRT